MTDILAYCDGTRDLLAVAETIGVPLWKCVEIVEAFKAHQLLRAV